MVHPVGVDEVLHFLKARLTQGSRQLLDVLRDHLVNPTVDLLEALRQPIGAVLPRFDRAHACLEDQPPASFFD